MGVGSILDQTLTAQTREDGTVATLPTTILSDADAALLGEYESWLSRARLTRKLYCKDCGLDSEVAVFVEPGQIGLTCGHRMLFYQGHVPVRLTEYPEAGEPALIVRVTIPDEPIAVADAYMLRRYQKFCQTYGLAEALWCLRCEDEGNPSGCKAYVRVDRMAILCRCANRVFHGLAV